MAIDPAKVKAAVTHLRRRDPVMRDIIDRVGEFGLQPRRDRFQMLVRSILSQQISTAAAKTIRQRLEQLAGPEGITPERLRQFDAAQLRTAGISAQKAGYLLDLAQQVASGQVGLRNIGRRDDEQVIAELTRVKGIGRWTAQMFLIFSLGRLDVFPHDDLGIRVALRDNYGLDDLPDRSTSHAIAEPWRPYATVASWYCWRTLD